MLFKKGEFVMIKKESEKTAPVKAEEVKTEVKNAEVKTPEVKAEVKKPEVKKAVAKKPEVKKAAAKKTGVKKAETKKAETKKAPAAKRVAAKKDSGVKRTYTRKAVEVKTEVYVQFSGKSLSQAELVKMAQDVWQYDMNMKAEDFKSIEIYVKPEENMAYFVVNDKFQGSFAL